MEMDNEIARILKKVDALLDSAWNHANHASTNDDTGEAWRAKDQIQKARSELATAVKKLKTATP